MTEFVLVISNFFYSLSSFYRFLSLNFSLSLSSDSSSPSLEILIIQEVWPHITLNMSCVMYRYDFLCPCVSFRIVFSSLVRCLIYHYIIYLILSFIRLLYLIYIIMYCIFFYSLTASCILYHYINYPCRTNRKKTTVNRRFFFHPNSNKLG